MKEEEIDLIVLIEKLWEGRKIVLKYLICFALIGLFVAMFSQKLYTSKTIMLPSSSDNSMNGSLNGLASIAGISLGKTGGDHIVPTIYPQIVKSVPFKKKLLMTKISVEGVDRMVTLREYYEEIYNPGVLAWLKKYTIGLPGVIIGAIRGGNSENKIVSKKQYGEIVTVSNKEEVLFALLESQINVEVNSKEGYITIEASMPEAKASAQLTEDVKNLLKEYIANFKSKKAIEELVFVEKLYEEKKNEFNKIDMELALFKDRNKNIATATVAREEKRLQAEYSLKYTVYTDLAKQMETKKIEVKENTPVFTIIEPVSIPIRKSKPKRLMILIIWSFLGGLIGVGVVFGRDFIKNIKQSRV